MFDLPPAHLSDLFQYVYVSTAITEFTEADLEELLERSRRRNSWQDITGLLLYRGGNFIQVLEGPSSALAAVLEDIVRDDRHHCFLQLHMAPIAEREFPDWSMGFRNIDGEPMPAGFSGYLREGPYGAASLDATPAKILLGVFRDNMR